MTSIFDFTINYRSDDEQVTSEMFVLVPKSYKINKLSNFVPQTKKKRFILHFDSHFVFCSIEDEFCGHFFFLLNLLVSNVYSYSTNMLPQIRHIIVNIYSSILIVTVYTLKTANVSDLKVK